MAKNVPVERFSMDVHPSVLHLRFLHWGAIDIETENDIIHITPIKADVYSNTVASDGTIQVFTSCTLESGSAYGDSNRPAYYSYTWKNRSEVEDTQSSYSSTPDKELCKVYKDWSKSSTAIDIIKGVANSDEVKWWKSDLHISIPFEKWKLHQEDAKEYYRGLVAGKKFGF